jgi:hypothetical protein
LSLQAICCSMHLDIDSVVRLYPSGICWRLPSDV